MAQTSPLDGGGNASVRSLEGGLIGGFKTSPGQRLVDPV